MPVDDAISTLIRELAPQFVAIRHHLHQNPELSEHEEQTSAVVAERLRAIGVDSLKRSVGGHGVLAQIDGAETGRVLALRADMDALPIQEESELPYRSCRPGVMHACGHDGHTSTLLGAAAALAQLRDRMRGSVRLIFQPAEETVDGAARMCEGGAMEGVDAVLALHGWPGLEVGRIGVRVGAMMASSDTFEIQIQGRGAHAAMPHNAVDPIFVGAHVVLALQSLASREISPVEPVVVTVAQFHAGTAHNIIPEVAVLRGTVRCLAEDLRREMPEKIERIARGICEGFRAGCRMSYRFGTGVTSNDAGAIDLVREAAAEALGPDGISTLPAPSMGAEDFAFYLQHAPGAMFRLGVGADSPNLHTPRYNFADDAVAVGMEVFVRAAVRYLS